MDSWGHMEVGMEIVGGMGPRESVYMRPSVIARLRLVWGAIGLAAKVRIQLVATYILDATTLYLNSWLKRHPDTAERDFPAQRKERQCD